MSNVGTLAPAAIISRDELTALSLAVATQGVSALDDSIPRLVGAAQAVGVPAVLPQVLAGAAEPEVARIRAFVKISYRLTAAGAGAGATI